jgi:hypothetical protein
MSRKKFTNKVLLVLLLIISTTLHVGAQGARIHFYCANNRQDSIMCAVQITKRNGEHSPLTKYMYSCQVNIEDCDQINCYPDEPETFWAAKTECLTTNTDIFIEVKSAALYDSYKRRKEKVMTTPRDLSVLHEGNKVGQNSGTIEKAVTF